MDEKIYGRAGKYALTPAQAAEAIIAAAKERGIDLSHMSKTQLAVFEGASVVACAWAESLRENKDDARKRGDAHVVLRKLLQTIEKHGKAAKEMHKLLQGEANER